MSLLGKIIFGVAEYFVDGMRSTAYSNSRNKKFSEEDREKWSDLEEGLGDWKSSIKDAKKKYDNKDDE